MIVTTYTFDASAKTIVSSNFLDIERIQLITNVTDNIIIYNFADDTLKGTLSSTTLTLQYDTATMDDADELKIIYADDGVVYNSTPPTLADGDTAPPQADVNGNTKVVEQFIPTAEDDTNGVIKVEQRYDPFSISTATTTTVRSGPGYIDEIICVGGTLGNVTIYDNTAASGTVLLPAVTPLANGILLRHVKFGIGLTIVTASATIIVGGTRLNL